MGDHASTKRIASDIAVIGSALTARKHRWRPTLRLEERMINLVMADPSLRVRMFRFTEAFPAFRGPQDTMDHLVEYLGTDDMPWWMRTPVNVAARVPFGATIAHWFAKAGIGRMAKQFIAGQDAATAADRIHALWDDGIGVVVDALGEKTITDTEAGRYALRVRDLVEGLGSAAEGWAPNGIDADHHGPLPRISIAIKPTALSPKFSPLSRTTGLRDASDRLRPIIEAAVRHKVTVWFDMEQYAVKDMTHEMFRSLSAEFPDADVGIVVQAYLTDSYDDLAVLLDWAATKPGAPIGIRLVKGAYWDYETVTASAHGWPIPVYQNKPDTDTNYERCTQLLNERHSSVRPAYASHNLRSLAHAIADARSQGLPTAAVEIQTLQGMATDLPARLVEMGIRSRVYLPIGDLIPGMSYLVRRLLENTSNESFVRQQQSGAHALEELLAAPVVSTPVVGT